MGRVRIPDRDTPIPDAGETRRTESASAGLVHHLAGCARCWRQLDAMRDSILGTLFICLISSSYVRDHARNRSLHSVFVTRDRPSLPILTFA